MTSEINIWSDELNIMFSKKLKATAIIVALDLNLFAVKQHVKCWHEREEKRKKKSEGKYRKALWKGGRA